MRVLQSGIYKNFLQDQATAKQRIDTLTTQISSGKKIQNSYEDNSVYVDTLRLDSEINSLKGIQNRTEKSKVITDASDSAMNDMNLTLIDFKSKLIQASNDTINTENRKSIANELDALKDHLISLANSSINGEYLFAGSAVGVQPIDSEGNYHGNGERLKTQVSERMVAPYSVDGESLFLGFDSAIKKVLSSNVNLQNQTTNDTLTGSDSVEDLMGSTSNAHFYLSGVKHDGTAFKEKITLNASDDMTLLLERIETAYGNDDVNAGLSSSGTIIINDLKSGNSKLDFQMIASNEDVTDISTLVNKIEFTTSHNSTNDDLAAFTKSGNQLSGNVPLLEGDGFASAATSLSTIANISLDGKAFAMDMTDVNGVSKTLTLNLSTSSTFSVGGSTYNIYDADDGSGATQTTADNFTLGQLNNIISMAMSDSLPASTTSKNDFDVAIKSAKPIVSVGLNDSGNLVITDKSENNSAISFSLYDSDTHDFSATASLSFMSNKAVVLENPKVNFFKDLDTIIEAVRENITNIDANGTNPQNPGIQNAIAKIDTLTSHISKAHTSIGAMSNNLQSANERASTLQLNVTQLKSQITDVDLAEAIIQYEQVSLNYQAMMSTISRVNSLTLLNYLN